MVTLARVAAAVVSAVILPSVAFAQASMTGTVRDSSGAVLPGATVEAASPVLIEKVRVASTDGNGRYQLVDLRPGVAPANFEIRLKPSRRLLIQVRDENAVGMRFQVLDESGISLVGHRLYQSAPFGVSLPDGSYRVQLLDANRKLVCEKPVTLGSDGATVELAR